MSHIQIQQQDTPEIRARPMRIQTKMAIKVVSQKRQTLSRLSLSEGRCSRRLQWLEASGNQERVRGWNRRKGSRAQFGQPKVTVRNHSMRKFGV